MHPGAAGGARCLHVPESVWPGTAFRLCRRAHSRRYGGGRFWRHYRDDHHQLGRQYRRGRLCQRGCNQDRDPGVHTMSAHLQPDRARMAGFSMVELMVAIVLGLLVTDALVAMFVGVRSASRMSTGVAALSDSGRFALDTIEEN